MTVLPAYHAMQQPHVYVCTYVCVGEDTLLGQRKKGIIKTIGNRWSDRTQCSFGRGMSVCTCGCAGKVHERL